MENIQVSEYIKNESNNIVNKKEKKEKDSESFDISDNVYLEGKASHKSKELKSFLSSYEKALSLSEKVNLGAYEVFQLLGNIRSLLIENISGLGNNIQQKEIQSKIQGILSEIDARSHIKFNEIKLFNGALNINFLIFNKNYNLNLNQDLSIEGLDIKNLDLNDEKAIEKIEDAIKQTEELIKENQNFEKQIKNKEKNKTEEFHSVLLSKYNYGSGLFINTFI